MKQPNNESPADLSSRFADLSPAKRALLQQRLKKKRLDFVVKQSIPRRAAAESTQLSFAQQRLWFLDQYEPNGSVYNVSSGLRLKGRLDIDALKQSIAEIVRRHEALRTTFANVKGEPLQVIAPAVDDCFTVIDLRDRDENEREDQAQRLTSGEARRSFDLEQGPLFRATLVRLDEADHILVLVMHHIVSDGWSMGIFHRELSILYQAFSCSQSFLLEELPIQYADYAVWQRQWLQGEILESQLAYWRKQLQKAPGILDLPKDHPRPAVQNYRGARQSIQLSRELTQGLKALSQKEGVTLFMTLLAAFNTLLYRYTGQADIVVGSPIAGRNRTEIEGLIGFFVNTLVLRSDLSGTPSFRELLRRVRKTCLEAYEHQDLPFEKLVEELKPERSLSHSPLFQVMFVLQNTPDMAYRLEGLSVSPVRITRETAKFDFTLFMQETGDGLTGSLQYSTDLFNEQTILRLLGHFEVLLHGIVSNPQQTISALPILTEAEERQFLTGWNGRHKECAIDKCLHELFEEQAERTPDNIAVMYEDQQLTYRALNRRVNQLAHYLRGLGVGPEIPVGICVERSLEMIICLLGILKAGGAYVPFDPALPKDRLAFMLEDSRAAVLLTQQRLVEGLPKHRGRVVCLDTEWPVISEGSKENLISQTTGKNLVYVLFTSGSTGKPKGVAVEHQQLVNYLAGVLERLELPEGASFATVSTFAADLGNTAIFPALCTGGCLHVISQERASDPDALADYFGRHPIDCLKIVPSHLEALLICSHPERVLPRKRLVLGGEVSRWDLIEKLHVLAPDCVIINHYGPTEATVGVLTYRLEKSRTVSPSATLPIGRPITNTEIWLLDSHLRPVPIGVPGELYIGGASVTRGYLNQPELTAERFIPNPFSDDPKARLYKTGDLARYLPDRNVEFLGRIDDQVKIRGFRIELAEIETVLAQHPSLHQVVVVARENDSREKQLVAYGVPYPEQPVTATDLRNFLKTKLPDYMVPSSFVLTDALPLTPNGKPDRNALPTADQSCTEFDSGYVAPRTPVEELLSNIWATVLKLNKAGRHDNFFELGGHSLKATQVISRVNQTFKVDLPLRSLFETPTVAGLAERIENLGRHDDHVQTIPIVSVSRDKDPPLSFSQQRLWFLDQLEPNSPLYNVYQALRLSGILNVAALEKSIAAIVARHETLRTTFGLIDGEPVQVMRNTPDFELARIDLHELRQGDRELELQRLLREESRRPFKLSSDLMLRATLFELAEQEHVLLLATHHIASDGWSVGVLFRELTVLYEAFCHGKSSPLPQLPIQYADFAVWQREHLQGEVLGSQLSYWKNQLAGAPFLLNLATDRPRQTMLSHRGRSHSFILPKGLSDELKTLSRRESVTLYMTLLAAFNVLLHRHTRQTDLVIGSPIAGRNRPEIEDLIGFFVNTLVLRTDLSGEISFKELLGRVRKVVLDAFSHQDLPFEKLVEVLRPKRNTSHRSLVQVAFAFQNVPRLPLQLAGLCVSPVRIESERAKVDLTLFMWETEEGLAGSLNYAAELFDPGTIGRMAEYFQRLLEVIVADPERPLQKLPPLAHEVRSATLVESSGEATLDPYESSNLTRNQLLMWAGQKLAPGLPVYNAPYTFIIHGEVDPIHLQRAFEALVNSSDALRTVIREIDGIPQQSVRTELSYKLEYLDFSKQLDAQSALKIWLQTRCPISFDLGERLFDSALIRLEEKRFIWYLNVHHIITDNRSMEIIYRWVSELYGRSVAGILQDRVELPRFSDYLDYAREYRGSQRYQDIDNYWKQKLSEKLETLSFFGKRPTYQTSRIERVSCDLGLERSQNLRRLAGRGEIAAPSQNASLFNVFAALLVAYLYRITGIRQHSIGAPVHNRKSEAFRSTIGLFFEVVSLRVTVGEDDTFLSLVSKIKAEASEIFRFPHTLGNPPQNRAYDVLLNFRTATFPGFNNMPTDVKNLPVAYENHSLALQIHDLDTPGSFVIDFDFHPDVFDLPQRELVVNHFLQILDALLDDPGQSVDRPSLLTERERNRIVTEFNQTKAQLSEAESLLTRLFETQVKKTPDHPALLYEDDALTYGELNTRANQLAHHLSSLGVGPDKIVAICLESSPQAIVGILGILKAGGAYLPLDPHYPRERLTFMLEDSQASVLLIEKKLLDECPNLNEIITPKNSPALDAQTKSTPDCKAAPRPVVYLDMEGPDIAARSQENPGPSIAPNNLAYVIYTSGSTGRAKGVTISHGGVCNRLLWEKMVYPFSARDRALQKSSLAFDTSVLEIFRPLLLGAVMVMARAKDRQDSRYLADLIGKHKVTIAEFVPSMLALLLEEKEFETCTQLKHVFSGGEVLSFELQKKFFSRSYSALYNTYGPTEASIDVTHWKCDRDGQQAIVPLGSPIANTAVYILDRHLNPVPIGVAGEVYVAGAGLARGYLNRSDLTAEKFLPNPFSAVPGARLYRTGDLARHLPDGNIEFLGRLDHQVKIRGFRVELGEIEAVLRQHSGVHNVAVLARDDSTDEGSDNLRSKSEDPQLSTRLIAYIVPRDSIIVNQNELREFLRRKLPGYMIPAAFIFLDAIHLTSNGKMDLNALPAPDGDRSQPLASFVAPRTPTEEVLAEIWATLLGVHPVGIHDNFFDLGGHSLLAVRLFTEIEKAFNKRPPLSSLFQEATIESLASVINQQTKSTAPPSLVAIQPQGSKLPFFCVHEFFGDVLCYLNLARHLGDDQPVYALQPRGLEGGDEPFTDVVAMAAYYVDIIRAVQPRGPYALGGLCFGGVIAFEMAQQLRAKGESVALVALLDSGIGLNVGRSRWWWRFFRNLPLDFRSWVTGSLQLTSAQWLEVIKIKTVAAKGQLAGIFRVSSADCQPNDVAARLKRLGDVFQFSDRHQRVARAQYRALKDYKAQTYAGRLTLFRARMQPLFSSHDPHKGWSRVAAGGVNVKNIPGNHLGMLQEPHVQVLARELSACLQQARSKGSDRHVE